VLAKNIRYYILAKVRGLYVYIFEQLNKFCGDFALLRGEAPPIVMRERSQSICVLFVSPYRHCEPVFRRGNP